MEENKTVVCGKIFSTNKYGKVKNCSTECAVISSNLKKRAKRESKANN